MPIIFSPGKPTTTSLPAYQVLETDLDLQAGFSIDFSNSRSGSRSKSRFSDRILTRQPGRLINFPAQIVKRVQKKRNENDSHLEIEIRTILVWIVE